MREILFRGKTYDGEWVEGFLFNSQLCRIFWATAFNEEEDNMFYCEGKDVNPETVGQFTGLTDKNGKKIFEGDIVKDRFGRIMEVVFREKVVKVVFRLIKTTGKEWTNNFCFAEMEEWFWADIPDVEVIGNRWDNPELLEKDKCN